MFVGVLYCAIITRVHTVQPPEEIEGDEELEELGKPPRPASPLGYTDSNLQLCKCIM